MFTCLGTGLHLGADERSRLPWIAAALVLYSAVVAITLRINVPLNNDIKAAGDPDLLQDFGRVRESFDETRWIRWNTLRAMATIAAFGCLAWALVLHGRATP
ncbi:MAG: anthrone oxygenase family protein [Gaiellaceae bacterium]